MWSQLDQSPSANDGSQRYSIDLGRLPEEAPSGLGSLQTGFGNPEYGGPMPPNGHGTHRYYFWVMALNDDLNLEPGLPLAELLRNIEPHVIGMNRLVGTYSRV